MVPEDKVSAMITHNKRHWHIVLVSSNIQPTPLRSGLNLSGLDPDEGIVIIFAFACPFNLQGLWIALNKPSRSSLPNSD